MCLKRDVFVIAWVLVLCSCAVDAADTRFWPLGENHSLNKTATMDMVTGPQGFLWLATESGLLRYDGYQVKRFNYDPNASSGLSSNSLRSLAWDNLGYLWVGTDDSGLNRFSPESETFVTYQHNADDPNSLSGNTINALLVDKDGLLWVGTKHGGLNRLDPATGKIERQPLGSNSQLPGINVRALIQDSFGQIWIAMRDKGLVVYQGPNEPLSHFNHDPDDSTTLSSNYARSLFEDNLGRIWVGTIDGGFNLYQAKSNNFKRFLSPQSGLNYDNEYHVVDFAQDSQGDIWVASWGDGLSRIDGQTLKVERFIAEQDNPYALPNNVISNLYFDPSGLLWISTYYRGIATYDPKHQAFAIHSHHTDNPNSLSNNEVKHFAEKDDEHLWVATYGGGLNLFNRSTGKFEHFRRDINVKDSLSDDRVWRLLYDHQGRLWVGTSIGLNRLKPSGKGFIQYRTDKSNPHALQANTIFSMYEDRENRLWVGPWYGGLSRYRPQTDDFVTYLNDRARADSLPSNNVKTMLHDSRGDFWVGTTSGLAKMLDEETGRFKIYRHTNGDRTTIPANSINQIFEDAKQQLWIVTSEGIAQYNRQTDDFFQPIAPSRLAQGTTMGMLEDKQNNLWLFTESGTYRYEPDKDILRHYTVKDGLMGNSIHNGAFYQDKNGHIYLGGHFGFSHFDPGNIKPDKSITPVRLTQFSILNKPLPTGHSKLSKAIGYIDQLELNYRDYMFAFEFAGLNLRRSQNLVYRYRLEGFDQQWFYTEHHNRKAVYTNVPAGSYRFVVNTIDNDGTINPEQAAITLTMTPPWWKTPWAYALYVILVVSGLYWFARSQRQKVLSEQAINQQLRAVDKLKDDFLSNTSHELRTPLNGIIGLADSLLVGAGGELPARAKEDLSLIVSSGKRLSAMVNDILDFSKMRNQQLLLKSGSVDMFALTEVVLKLSSPMVTGKQLVLINQIDPLIVPVRGDEDRLMQIMHNLIGNAIKFTPTGTIKVQAKVDNRFLAISVIDTGIGIEPQNQSRIFDSFIQADGSIAREYGGTGIGLAITKQLVALQGGEIWLESVPTQGSNFSFTLPLSDETKPAIQPATSDTTQLPAAIEQTALPHHSLSELAGDYRILVVDDDPINLKVLENQLRLSRFEVHKAADGFAALEQLKNNGPFDLVLLDVMMPRLSGFNVCERIRESMGLAKMPVILLTAKNQDKDIVSGFNAGANDYVIKPFSQPELLARIKTHLELADYSRNLENKVQHRTEELTQANERLITLSEFKEGMMGMIVHDLKAPLQSLLLASDDGNGAQSRHIQRSATSMLNMVFDILDVQKFADAKMQLSPISVNIKQLAAQAIEQLQYLSDAKSLTINNQMNDIRVMVDSHVTFRILVNLLSNAIKFSNSQSTIVLRAVNDTENECRIEVRDHGQGIDADKLKAIFEPFYQGEQKHANRRGTGLGLTFCKLAVEAHGGTISATSNQGGGTIFTLTLPLSKAVSISPIEKTNQIQQPDPITLSEPHRRQLQHVLVQLQQVEVYRVSKIHQILAQLPDDDETINRWHEALLEAVENGNQVQYHSLL